jgi:hypothetical protein
MYTAIIQSVPKVTTPKNHLHLKHCITKMLKMFVILFVTLSVTFSYAINNGGNKFFSPSMFSNCASMIVRRSSKSVSLWEKLYSSLCPTATNHMAWDHMTGGWGQSTVPRRPIYSWKLLLRNYRTRKLQCGGAPSCRQMILVLSYNGLFSNSGKTTSRNTSRYYSPDTSVPWRRGQGWSLKR